MSSPLLNSDFIIEKAVVHHTVEDQLLHQFFKIDNGAGTFVDIGGNLPENAVSKPFLTAGWRGILVEPIPSNAQKFRDAGWPLVEEAALTSPEKSAAGTASLYLAGGDAGPHSSLNESEIDPRSLNNNCIKVKLNVLQNLLNSNEIKHIDLLSIDTEGTELDVLKGIDFKKVSIDLILIEDWQRDWTIHRFLRSKGFKIILRSGFNSWYVPKSMGISPPLLGYLKLLKKIYLSSHIKRFKHWMDIKGISKNKPTPTS